jgi:hypothetical protein
MPQTTISASGIGSSRRSTACADAMAACGQVSRPKARAASMMLCKNMPVSSQAPTGRSRSTVITRPTGASKNR